MTTNGQLLASRQSGPVEARTRGAEVVVNSVTDLVVMGVADFFYEQDDRNRGRASDRTGVEAAPPASQPAF